MTNTFSPFPDHPQKQTAQDRKVQVKAWAIKKAKKQNKIKQLLHFQQQHPTMAQSPYQYDSPISPSVHTSPVTSPSIQPYSSPSAYSPGGITSPSQHQPYQSPHQMSSPMQYGQQQPHQHQQLQQPLYQMNKPGLVPYICANCGYENWLSPESLLRCQKCPHRIMFKKRTNRRMFCSCVFFEN